MVMGWWKHLNPSLLGDPKLDKLGNGPFNVINKFHARPSKKCQWKRL